MSSPKVFISYSWSSPEHEKWVVNFATQLRENGADAILDKWDLKEGHDAVAFMEQMVTNADVKKVIVVTDRTYASRADKRAGGVGTETQIISAEVYEKTTQDKFVAVVTELNEYGKPYLPAYYRSRIYIDLTNEESYARNFDQLIRWIYDKPLHIKPELGKQPEFLNENAITLGTQSRSRRAIEAIRNHNANARSALDDYLTTFAEEFERFRISDATDEAVINNIEEFLPYRNEYIEVLSILSRYNSVQKPEQSLHRFFEQALAYCYKPPHISSWRTWDFDNFKFIVHELFLYTIAILLRQERFADINNLLSGGFYLGDAAENQSNPIENFRAFRHYLESLAAYNQSQKLNKLSLHADLLEKRGASSGLKFSYLMQADFILFVRDSVEALHHGTRQRWWPETLIYAQRQYGPFEIFARSQSSAYFDQIKEMLGISSPDELRTLIKSMDQSSQSKLRNPSWGFSSVDTALLSGIDKIATRI